MAIKKENPTGSTDKQKALETAMAQIEKAYGKGSIMRLGENQGIAVEAVPTGSLGLDIALGIGGVPRGRIIEIYGPESSGKTTLALHILAEAQKLGGEAAFIDAEHALDPNYAKALGVDIDSMLISQPDTGEQGLEICEALVRSGAVDVVERFLGRLQRQEVRHLPVHARGPQGPPEGHKQGPAVFHAQAALGLCLRQMLSLIHI